MLKDVNFSSRTKKNSRSFPLVFNENKLAKQKKNPQEIKSANSNRHLKRKITCIIFT
jgi:hypothetical protein